MRRRSIVLITSRTPNARKRETVISSSVRPAISTSAFGRLSVSGRKRVPSPAAKIMAFMEKPSLERSPLAQFLQLKMPYRHLQPVPAAQTLRQLFRQIDRAMLAAGAAERHHQILEAAALVIAHAGVHQR